MNNYNVRNIAILKSLAEGITADFGFDRVIAIAGDKIHEMLSPEMTLVYLVEGDKLILGGMRPERSAFRNAGGECKKIGECLCGLVANSGRPIYCADIATDPRCTRKECKELGIRSFAAIPLVNQNKVLGVLGLASSTPADFSESAEVLEIMAAQISVSLINSFLYEDLQRQVNQCSFARGDLEKESSFKAAIIELAGEGVCVCHEIAEHPYVEFTIWNRNMKEITGYSMAEINRLGWYQTLYPDPLISKKASERMHRMRLGDNLDHEEWEIVRADGCRRIVSISTAVLGTQDNTTHVLAMIQDVTERKSAENDLRGAHAELVAKNIELERINTALKVLLDQRERDKSDLEEAILANIQMLIVPELENLKRTRLSDAQSAWVERIELNINQIASPYVKRLSHSFMGLTPTEIRIAEKIKNGMRTKEIADLLGVSSSTVLSHRESLREKLGLKGKKTNLISWLRSFE